MNRTSTKSFLNTTPQEAFSRHKPTIGHLRTFGCITHSHIPIQKRNKLDDISEILFYKVINEGQVQGKTSINKKTDIYLNTKMIVFLIEKVGGYKEYFWDHKTSIEKLKVLVPFANDPRSQFQRSFNSSKHQPLFEFFFNQIHRLNDLRLPVVVLHLPNLVGKQSTP
ncbi:hypothetical protein OSB04_019304 [Centaurea solstitialis]|uniref:Uncharacterized protein n=1 Tax=Centaurea solstitialis TaxID=347529 RepID=A0AA38T1K4_9ASTR|nr:hypothetical protein OSB04_019304 [Centaurea solstitialis]